MRSKSKAEDSRRRDEAPDRVTKEHGGELVEAISEEELSLVNDPKCKHVKLVRDPSEKDFNAFICSNADCGVVVLFDKGK